jgi:hypothetical protein
LVFVDTETTGLTRPYLAHGRRVWEIGIIRRETDRTERRLHLFIGFPELGLVEMLPRSEVTSASRLTDDSLPWSDRLKMGLPENVLYGLDIGQFFERHPDMNPSAAHESVVNERVAAEILMDEGWLSASGPARTKAHFFGAVPSFDDLSLADLLHRSGMIGSEPPWHYHLVDVEAYAAGHLGLLPPWNSKEITRQLGLDPGAYAEHTAMGDAEWARDMFDVTHALASRGQGEA